VFGAVIVLGVVAVIGTYSRGALLALAAMGIVMWLHSRRKLIGLLIGGLALVTIATYTTEAWRDRAGTIANYAEDPSFVGRRDAWMIAYEVALGRPLIGLGMRVPYLQQEVDPYLSTRRTARAAHSIYFEMLGSAGFVGLALFLGILASVWRATGSVLRLARDIPERAWAADLARATRAGLAAFAVGGAGLSMEFWDGFWTIAVLMTATQSRLEARQVASAGTAEILGEPGPVPVRLPRC
jgi:probable O-glycosylation ligase (exosortase A-associated)